MTVPAGTEQILTITIRNNTGYKLNAAHRCDSCDSRAYVHIILRNTALIGTSGALMFCSHHWNQHKDALFPRIICINDETQQLRDGIKDDHWVEGKPQSLPPRQKQPWEKP